MTLEKQDAPVEYPEKVETDAGPVTVFDPMFELKWAVV